jgi:hypothetical protein
VPIDVVADVAEPDAPSVTIGWATVRRELKTSLALPALDVGWPGLGPAAVPHPIVRIRLDRLLRDLVANGRLAPTDASAWRAAACLNGVHAILTPQDGSPPDGSLEARIRRAVERADRALRPADPEPGEPLDPSGLQQVVLDAARPAIESSSESRLGELVELRRLAALNHALSPAITRAATTAHRALTGQPGATLISCAIRHLHDLIIFGGDRPGQCPACAGGPERRLGRSYVRAIGLFSYHLCAALERPARPKRRALRPTSGSGPPAEPAGPEPTRPEPAGPAIRGTGFTESAAGMVARAQALWDVGEFRPLQPLLGSILAREHELPADDRAEMGYLHCTLLYLSRNPAAGQVLQRELSALPADGGSPRRAVVRVRLESELLYRRTVSRPVSVDLLSWAARNPARTRRLLAGAANSAAAPELIGQQHVLAAMVCLHDPGPGLEPYRLAMAHEQLTRIDATPTGRLPGWKRQLAVVLAARRTRARHQRPGEALLDCAHELAGWCDRQQPEPGRLTPLGIRRSRVISACLEGRISVLAGDRAGTRIALARIEDCRLAPADPLVSEVAALTAVIRDRARSTRGWSSVLHDALSLTPVDDTGPGPALPSWLTPRGW